MDQFFLFSYELFSRYQCHDIDVSIDVTTLKALKCTNSKIVIAFMTLMLTNELYRHDSRHKISLVIVIDVKMTSN